MGGRSRPTAPARSSASTATVRCTTSARLARGGATSRPASAATTTASARPWRSDGRRHVQGLGGYALRVHRRTPPPAAEVSLYRYSAGHGNLQCEACHNSTHAEFTNKPSANGQNQVNDNLRAVEAQGYAAAIRKCAGVPATVPNTNQRRPARHAQYRLVVGHAASRRRQQQQQRQLPALSWFNIVGDLRWPWSRSPSPSTSATAAQGFRGGRASDVLVLPQRAGALTGPTSAFHADPAARLTGPGCARPAGIAQGFFALSPRRRPTFTATSACCRERPVTRRFRNDRDGQEFAGCDRRAPPSLARHQSCCRPRR